MDEIELFKRGIFSLGTNFGELAQLMIMKLENYLPADGKYYDLKDSYGQKIEVKFSRVVKKSKKMTLKSAISCCLNANMENRAVSIEDAKNTTYDCNIQQLKPSEFDILYYGLFFRDKIVIFRANTDVVPQMPGYSIQHNGGHEYQFHIKKSNYEFHYQNYKYKKITYQELYDLLCQ